MRLRCIDHGESVTAKLNSASPPTFASPRGHGGRGFAAGEKSREMKREGGEEGEGGMPRQVHRKVRTLSSI